MQSADRQEKWGYTLANIGQMELQNLSQEDDVFRSVFEDSMHKKLTKMEKEEYKKSVLEYEDMRKAVRYAEKLGREEGRGRAVWRGARKRNVNSPATYSPKVSRPIWWRKSPN